MTTTLSALVVRAQPVEPPIESVQLTLPLEFAEFLTDILFYNETIPEALYREGFFYTTAKTPYYKNMDAFKLYMRRLRKVLTDAGVRA